MGMAGIISLILLFIIGFGLLVFLLLKLSSQQSSQLTSQLNTITQQLNERLKDSSDTLLQTQRDVTERLNKISDVENLYFYAYFYPSGAPSLPPYRQSLLSIVSVRFLY